MLRKTAEGNDCGLNNMSPQANSESFDYLEVHILVTLPTNFDYFAANIIVAPRFGDHGTKEMLGVVG